MSRFNGLIVFVCSMLVASTVTAGAVSRDAEVSPQVRREKVHQRVARQSAEVTRLKHDVADQEARSREASRRLQEQDQALERLRRELQSAGQHDASGVAGS